MRRMYPMFLLAAMLIGVSTAGAQTDSTRPDADSTKAIRSSVPEEGSLLCPVTGEEGDKEVSLLYEGKNYYFCCANCRKNFQDNPGKYLKKKRGEGGTTERN